MLKSSKLRCLFALACVIVKLNLNTFEHPVHGTLPAVIRSIRLDIPTYPQDAKSNFIKF